MDLSKLKRILFILLCLFIVLFPFWCVRGLCAEIEDLNFDIVSGIRIRNDTNYFVSADSYNVGYLQVEKGYIYHIHKVSGTVAAPIAFCNTTPAVNVTYDYVTSVNLDETYSFIPNNNDILIVSFNTNTTGSTIQISREKLTNMDGTINELVNNVGTGNLWSIFEIAVQYIWVVVLVAFGIFIITRIIKKVSKAKGGM